MEVQSTLASGRGTLDSTDGERALDIHSSSIIPTHAMKYSLAVIEVTWPVLAGRMVTMWQATEKNTITAIVKFTTNAIERVYSNHLSWNQISRASATARGPA